MTRSLLSALFVLMLGGISFAEFPRSGVAEVPNGIAEPFQGEWAMGFPETEGTIANAPIHTCEMPVVISRINDTTIHYASPGGGDVEMELGDFEGRTPWFPSSGPSSIAVWTSPDSFNLHSVGAMGAADWDNPFELVRCP